MASPQKENGYTPISNELFEKILLFDFPSASPLKILMLLVRKIYGFQKKEDFISLTQICKEANLSRQTVVSSIEWLCNSNMILKIKQNNSGTLFRIQKDYEKWVVNAPRLVKAGRLLVVNAPRLEVVNAPRHTKETIKENKRNTVANATPSIKLGNEVYPMEELEYIPEYKPKAKAKYGNATMARFVRTYLEASKIEIGESYNASPWLKPLGNIYQTFDKDAEKTIEFIKKAVSYFESIGKSHTPYTLEKDLPMIDKWISDKNKTQNLEINRRKL